MPTAKQKVKFLFKMSQLFTSQPQGVLDLFLVKNTKLKIFRNLQVPAELNDILHEVNNFLMLTHLKHTEHQPLKKARLH